jgi:hypothetical protein
MPTHDRTSTAAGTDGLTIDVHIRAPIQLLPEHTLQFDPRERVAEPRRAQEQVIPLRGVRGALRGATILVDRLRMTTGSLEQVCTRRSQPMVGREARIECQVVQGSQAISNAMFNTAPCGPGPPSPHRAMFLTFKSGNTEV